MTSPTADPQRQPDLRARRRVEMVNTVHRLALRRFAEYGYERTSVADICVDADISERTFFRHFASKDELVDLGSRKLQDLVLENLRLQADGQLFTEAFHTAFVASIGELFRGDPQYARDTLGLSAMRGVFVARGINALHDPEVHEMDREFARRLGIEESDPRVRLIRGFVFICINQATAEWNLVDMANLSELVQRNLSAVEALLPGY